MCQCCQCLCSEGLEEIKKPVAPFKVWQQDDCEHIMLLPSGLLVGCWVPTKEAMLINGDDGYEMLMVDPEDIKNVITALQYYLEMFGE